MMEAMKIGEEWYHLDDYRFRRFLECIKRKFERHGSGFDTLRDAQEFLARAAKECAEEIEEPIMFRGLSETAKRGWRPFGKGDFTALILLLMAVGIPVLAYYTYRKA